MKKPEPPRFLPLNVKFVFGSNTFLVSEPKTTACLEARLQKYFPSRKPEPVTKRMSPRQPEQGFFASHQIRFDSILCQTRVVQIEAALKQNHFLRSPNFDRFVDFVEKGDGLSVAADDLATFVKLLPTELETKKFRDRLAEYNLENFGELRQVQKPFTVKLSGAEEFVTRVLASEALISKAKILQTLQRADAEIAVLDDQVAKWKSLDDTLVEHDTFFARILATCFQVALLMRNHRGSSSKPSGFDVGKSLMLFFEKKSQEAAQKHCLLYDVVLKEVARTHAGDDFSRHKIKDAKFVALEAMTDLFDEPTLSLIQTCVKNDAETIVQRLRATLSALLEVSQQGLAWPSDDSEFKVVMTKFSIFFEQNYKVSIPATIEELEQAQASLAEFLCFDLQSQDQKLEDVLKMLLGVHSKHRERVDGLKKQRLAKLGFTSNFRRIGQTRIQSPIGMASASKKSSFCHVSSGAVSPNEPQPSAGRPENARSRNKVPRSLKTQIPSVCLSKNEAEVVQKTL